MLKYEEIAYVAPVEPQAPRAGERNFDHLSSLIKWYEAAWLRF
jgi:hypothetical protein